MEGWGRQPSIPRQTVGRGDGGAGEEGAFSTGGARWARGSRGARSDEGHGRAWALADLSAETQPGQLDPHPPRWQGSGAGEEGLRDSAGRFRYMVGFAAEKRRRPRGHKDLAVNPRGLLQKRDDAAASRGQYGRNSEHRPALGSRGGWRCARTTGSFRALGVTARWRSARSATAANGTAARTARSRPVGSCQERPIGAIKPPLRGVTATRLGRRDTETGSAQALLRKK